jgi:ornithine carbamoyltransferase
MTAACPKGYKPLEEIVKLARAEGKKTGVDITITEDSASAVKDADIISTDTFISIGKEGERATREAAFIPKYQVNRDIMKLAKKDAIFMHCLPAKRGMEVTADVIDGRWSVVWQEAENRLHVQKALLCLLMKAAV